MMDFSDNFKRSEQLQTPVLFIIFNRPETTAAVFEAIRRARPACLYIVADGPREHVPEDFEKCQLARQVTDKIDWPCSVERLYSEHNLGCGKRPASGISWVFEQVDEAIILEDDCLPDPTFFFYCRELLERYRNDERIMHIAGNNRGFSQASCSDSYYLSLLPYCWGWATWKRAWRRFDYELSHWPATEREGTLRKLLPDRRTTKFWSARFADLYDIKEKDIWDYQWTFACWIYGGLAAVPNVNLVRNIGFDNNATHTLTAEPSLVNLVARSIAFPLIHPHRIDADTVVDGRAFREFQRGRFARLFDRVKSSIWSSD